ncbi:uncharacterized protein si:dkey-30c15.2 [Brienomyrus brachyistius]|uniref:uncharacterized protein si:dkey-30c15.2 n=1 Tax=Brienomyrus brachyistius TaxID=42636 RepID=UPI0020B4453D|nr:uncharacterized protein si:dkey-30c15.2 [Brienomyrus brachyistius]
MEPRADGAFRNALTNDQIETLSIVYLSSLSLSLLGSSSVLVAAVIKRRHLNKQAWPLLQLALADFLATVLLFLINVMNVVPSAEWPDNIPVCERLLPLSLAFYCVSFLLVVVYAYESQQAAGGWRERPSATQEQSQRGAGVASPISYAIAWMVPVIIYFFYIATEVLVSARIVKWPKDPVSNEGMSEKYTMFCSSCVLFLHIRNDTCTHPDVAHDIFVKCFFLISALSVLVCCAVIYHKVSCWLRRYEGQAMFPVEGDGFSRRQLRGSCMTANSMVLVIMFCWIPAIVLIVLSFIQSIPQEKLFPLYVTQALTISLQGFLDSIVYGWRRQNFREAMGERMPLLEKAFYDESLSAN